MIGIENIMLVDGNTKKGKQTLQTITMNKNVLKKLYPTNKNEHNALKAPL